MFELSKLSTRYRVRYMKDADADPDGEKKPVTGPGSSHSERCS